MVPAGLLWTPNHGARLVVFTIIFIAIGSLSFTSLVAHASNDVPVLTIKSQGAALEIHVLAPNGTEIVGAVTPENPLVLHLEPGTYKVWASIPAGDDILQYWVNGTIAYYENVTTTLLYLGEGVNITLKLPAPQEVLSAIRLDSGQAHINVSILKDGMPIFDKGLEPGANLTIWAPPGTYVVAVDYAPSFSGVFGPRKNLVTTQTVSLGPGDSTSIVAADPEGMIGIIVLSSRDLRATVTIRCSTSEAIYTLGPSTWVSLNVVPGIYNLTIEIVAEPDIGPNVSINKSLKLIINKSETINITMPGKSDILGRLVIDAPTTGILTIEWPTGNTSLLVLPGNPIRLWAAPANYTLSLEMTVPPAYPVVGGEPRAYWNTSVSVNSGSELLVALPSYTEFFSVIVLWTGGSQASVNITWQGGALSLITSPYSYRVVLAHPGDYTVTYAPQPPSGYLVIGNISNILKKTIININKPGEYKYINIPDYKNLTSKVNIIGPWEGVALVEIYWPGGNVSFYISPSELRELYAVRGNYTLRVSYAIQEYMLVSEPKEIIMNISIFNNITNIQIPSIINIYSKINVFIKESIVDVLYNVSVAGQGRVVWQIVRDGEPAIFYADPGNYTVRVVPILVNSSIVIGDLKILTREINISLKQNHELQWTLDDITVWGLARVFIVTKSLLNLSVLIEWSNRTVVLGPDDIRKPIYMIFGNYNITFLPNKSLFNKVIGPNSLNYYINNSRRAINALPGKTLFLKAPDLGDLFARLNITLIYPGIYEISWDNTSYYGNCSAYLYMVPGYRYVLSYSVAGFPEGIVVLGPVEEALRWGAESVIIEPEPGEVLDLTLGQGAVRLIQELARLVVAGPAGTLLVVEWPGGQRTLTIGHGNTTAYLIPDSVYHLRVFDPTTWSSSEIKEIIPKKNETIYIKINLIKIKNNHIVPVEPPPPGVPNKTIIINITNSEIITESVPSLPRDQVTSNVEKWKKVAIIELLLIFVLSVTLLYKIRSKYK